MRPSSSSSFPPFCGKKQIGHLRLLSLREREATFSHVWKRGGGREGDADDFFPSSSSSILPSSRFPLSTLRYIPRRSPPIPPGLQGMIVRYSLDPDPRRTMTPPWRERGRLCCAPTYVKGSVQLWSGFYCLPIHLFFSALDRAARVISSLSLTGLRTLS